MTIAATAMTTAIAWYLGKRFEENRIEENWRLANTSVNQGKIACPSPRQIQGKFKVI